jgi:hypothetical protein
VPVTVTVKLPLAEGVQDSVEVPEPATLEGLRVQVRPVEGEMETARLTLALNPLTGITVMVEVPVWPTLMVTSVGLELIWKSCTT